MRARILRWVGAVVVVVCAGAALAQESPPPSPPKQDSVAEAARKAKAAKAKGKAQKVYTEDDLSGLKRGRVSTVGEELVAPSDTETAADLPKDSLEAAPGIPPAGRDEAYWRERAGKLRSEIADVDRQIETVKEEIRKGGGAGFDPQSGLGQNVIYYTDRNSRLQRLEQRRAELQKQMDALLDEARKASVPPGWLR